LRDVLVVAALGVGTFFLLLGSYGLIRLPDVLCRMHATTKATTFGACGILVAALLNAGWSGVGLRALLAVGFLLLTAPVGAHMIARAAYRGRVPLADRTTIDELREAYETHGVWALREVPAGEVAYRPEDVQ
jgi:multicomponent Na+:H+ antiporter subunit G